SRCGRDELARGKITKVLLAPACDYGIGPSSTKSICQHRRPVHSVWLPVLWLRRSTGSGARYGNLAGGASRLTNRPVLARGSASSRQSLRYKLFTALVLRRERT